MEFEGKVISVSDIKSGVSQTSGKEWRNAEFVVEQVNTQYPKKGCFKAFNDMCNILPQPGAMVKVSFDIDAREYNGRWYNDIRAYKIEVAGAIQQPQQQQPQYQPSAAATANPIPVQQQQQEEQGKKDDLPF